MKKKLKRKKGQRISLKLVQLKKWKTKNIKKKRRKHVKITSISKNFIACLKLINEQKFNNRFQEFLKKAWKYFSADKCDQDSEKNKKLKVCVIGAGPAGLCMTRHLSDSLDLFDITVFEKELDVGGTWVYSKKTGYDENGYPIHSSMFKNLRTNLPKEIMNIPDYPVIKGSKESCILHRIVLRYLKNYTNIFNLRQFIHFNSPVVNIKLKNSEGSSDQWSVIVRNLNTSEIQEYTFDAVMICNGHYFDPCIPKIPGLENFCGQVLHSHSYRDPKVFKGKTVVCLGGASSGLDIALDLSIVAAKTYLSHNNPEKILKRNSWGFTEVPGIDRFENGKFILKNNKKLQKIDVLIFCTGYNFKFPFLDQSSGISVDDNYIKPLYKHIFNVEHPSMSFIGVPTGVVPFPLFYVQAQYITSVLKGKTQLPPKQVMEEDSKLKFSKKRYAHFLTNQWDYSDELASQGGFPPLPPYYRIGCDAWTIHKKKHPGNFKRFNLIIGADSISVKIVPICDNCWGTKL